MKFPGFIWIMAMVSINGLSQDIVINEVAYTNDNLVKDQQGDSPDWFELYNSSDNPVNLSAYKVTDDTAKTEYWSFPDFVLNPDEFLLVFASGKDTVWDREFHTSFRISNMRETLFLIGPGGQITDEILPVCVPINHSRARIPDGSGNMAVIVPTPSQSNNNSVPVAINFIPDTLEVSHRSGFYENPLTVTLQNHKPENEIRFTLDGEVPEEDAEIYSGPLQLSDITPNKIRFADIPETIEEPGDLIFKANILRALVFSDGCPASNEISNTYFINKDLRYPVPVVSLITERDNLFDEETGIYVYGKYRNFDQHGDEWERPVQVEIFDSNGVIVVDQEAGMRIHGRGSRKSPQKSLRLYADSEYGKPYFEYPYFKQKPQLQQFRVLLLRTTGGTLGPLFKEELCNSLVQEMELDYPAGETAILFINGEYWGIYNLMERQNRFYIEDNFGISGAEVDIIAYDRYVVAEEGTTGEYNTLVDYLQFTDPSSPGFYEEMSKRIDLVNMMDYYSAQLYFANFDWPLSNVEMWRLKNDTARWRYFFFDSDASMIWLNDDHLTEYNNDIGDFQRYPEFCTIIFKKLLNNERFRSEFMQRFTWHLSHTFSSGRVLKAIDKFESKYAPLVPEHIYRWRDPVNYLKWEDNVDWLRTFAVQRPIQLTEILEKNLGKFLEIQPNPSHGNFNLRFINQPETVDVKILSVNGVILQHEYFSESETSVISINTSLPPGIYVLQAEAETMWYTAKIIIQ